MRIHTAGIAILLLAAGALAPAPAAAFDTVEEVLCVCVEDVLNTGDYVSCLSHMTRRLREKGIIDRRERGEILSAAAATDLLALQDDCAAASGGNLEGWGASLQIERAFYPAPSPSGPSVAAIAALRLWNRTPEDIFQTTRVLPAGEGCEFLVTVRDGQDRQVRRESIGCPDAIGELDLASGVVLEREFLVPLVALDADPATGLVDDQKLPVGIYRVVVVWNAEGPQKTPGITLEGGYPTAVITLRVGG
jgi:hypothetical protein